MECRGITEFFALAPDRIVIVEAVDAEHIEPGGVAATDAELIGFGNRAANQTAERDRLDSDFFAMLEFRNRFLRHVHRNRANRRDAIGVLGPGIDRELIEGVASRATQFLVADIGREELAMRRVENREIE